MIIVGVFFASFLDLAKAFDSLDHTILMTKLYEMGIKGKTYDLIALINIFLVYTIVTVVDTKIWVMVDSTAK